MQRVVYPGLVLVALGTILALIIFRGADEESAALGAWTFDRAEVRVDVIPADRAADVAIDYTLEWTGDGTSTPGPVDVALLGLPEATVAEVIANGDVIVLWPASGSRRVAAIPAPPLAADGSAGLAIRYRVPGAVDVDGSSAVLRAPLLTGPSPRQDADGFHLGVHVPTGWRSNDAFPSGLRPDADGVLRASLAVVPAYVRMDARTDDEWEPGLPLVLDLVTILILGSFAFAGWRHLSRVVEARA
ncbi:MAG: hypothetical protein AAF389_14440 [Gemmatimonadota bacterium]